MEEPDQFVDDPGQIGLVDEDAAKPDFQPCTEFGLVLFFVDEEVRRVPESAGDRDRTALRVLYGEGDLEVLLETQEASRTLEGCVQTSEIPEECV